MNSPASVAILLTGLSFTFIFPVQAFDMSGVWEVAEEERTYQATVDQAGNGTYTWQNGVIFNSKIEGSR